MEGGEVYVVGEINQSSAIPYKPHMKVVHALAAGGGVTYRGGEVRVKRAGCWLEADYETGLAPGDVLMVTERFFLGVKDSVIIHLWRRTMSKDLGQRIAGWLRIWRCGSRRWC